MITRHITKILQKKMWSISSALSGNYGLSDERSSEPSTVTDLQDWMDVPDNMKIDQKSTVLEGLRTAVGADQVSLVVQAANLHCLLALDKAISNGAHKEDMLSIAYSLRKLEHLGIVTDRHILPATGHPLTSMRNKVLGKHQAIGRLR